MGCNVSRKPIARKHAMTVYINVDELKPFSDQNSFADEAASRSIQDPFNFSRGGLSVKSSKTPADQSKLMISQLPVFNENTAIKWNPSNYLESNIFNSECLNVLTSIEKHIQTIMLEIDLTDLLLSGAEKQEILRVINQLSVSKFTQKKFTKLDLRIKGKIFPSPIMLMCSKMKFMTKITLDFSDSDERVQKKLLAKCVKKNLNSIIFKFGFGINKITNKGLRYLSAKLENCQKLMILYLDFQEGKNKVTDKGIKHLGIAIGYLKHLQELYLNFSSSKIIGFQNIVTDKGLGSLSAGICKLRQLFKIQLYLTKGRCTISSKGLKKISKAINSKITHFELSLKSGQNHVDEAGIIEFFLKMESLHHLEYLYLDFSKSKNSMTDQGFFELSLAIEKMKKLNVLHLKFVSAENIITDVGIQFFSKAIANCNGMSDLNFHVGVTKSYITDIGIEGMAEGLKEMKQLAKLNLHISNFAWNISESLITDKSLFIIKEMIEDKLNLTELHIHLDGECNRFTDMGLISFASGLNDLKRLIIFDFSLAKGNNKISDVGIKCLSKHMLDINHIEFFFLNIGKGENTISDDGMKSISDAISLMKELKLLNLWFEGGLNTMGDMTMKYISSSLKSKKFFDTLYIDFRYGQNKISDYGIQYMAEGLLTVKTLKSVEIYVYGENIRVTENGQKLLLKLHSHAKNGPIDLHISAQTLYFLQFDQLTQIDKIFFIDQIIDNFLIHAEIRQDTFDNTLTSKFNIIAKKLTIKKHREKPKIRN